MTAIEPGSEIPPHWNVNFLVADTDALAEQARELGATIVMEPTDTITGFRGAAIADPQGAVFSISAIKAG
jgi:predicted enzyme related to lactoylglutathione lyase